MHQSGKVLLNIASLPKLLQLDILILQHIVIRLHIGRQFAIGGQEGTGEDGQSHRDTDIRRQDEHPRDGARDDHIGSHSSEDIDAHLGGKRLDVLPKGLAELLRDQLGISHYELHEVLGSHLRKTLHHARVQLESIGHLGLGLFLLGLLAPLRHPC